MFTRSGLLICGWTPLLFAGAASAQTASEDASPLQTPVVVPEHAEASAGPTSSGPSGPSVAPVAPVAANPVARPPAAPEAKGYDKLKMDAFVDAYAAVNYNAPKPETGGNLFHAYDATNGFALHWAGLNVSYAPDPVGATLGLRFGPGANIHGAADASSGLTNVKQAFATWKPGGASGKLTFDLGKFDQPFGSEIADSQGNMNYSRSFLYWLAQPLYFTGLRADYAPAEWLDVKVIVANGWNNSVDTNRGKTAAIQLNFSRSEKLLVAVG